jgi:hypothetical protein
MPELKRTFLKGRMNKDLDERLLPNGEYFDATNIQVNTSEDSDVGAIESILGNTVHNIKNADKSTWDLNFGLTSAKCIGGARDTQNNKIYWFITGTLSSDPANAILEYDEATDIVSVIIADIRPTASQVLNFNASNLITGINILDGMLFFTDNLNEPRKINISTFKASPTNTGVSVAAIDATTTLLSKKTNTQIDFTAEDINVIKKAPKQAAGFEVFPSLIMNGNLIGTGITPLKSKPQNFISSGYPTTSSVTLTFRNAITRPIQFRNKEVELKATIKNSKGKKEKYVVKGRVIAFTTTTLTIDPIIVPENLPDKAVPWEILIIEKDFIYKREFPRFSYRWRYTDGEYSSIAPFTDAVFLAGNYNYEGMDAENEGMLNHIRKIILTFPERLTTFGPPRDVDFIEVLYKSTKSNNIYIIKSAQLKEPSTTVVPGETTGDFGYTNDGEFIKFEITEELDGPVLPSSQLLRLFDAVPKKALAQEVIANRIVYGNYTEGYDEPNDKPNFKAKILDDNNFQTGTNAVLPVGVPSLKSDKTYQLGIAYLDEFNRESPVLTNNSGSIAVPKDKCNKSNAIEVSVSTPTPSWAKFFKYYIKDNYSTEYNLQLDRFYDSEDGNYWLSFPSTERNKITEDDILMLKKQHGENLPVMQDNEYRVIDIKNEPPDSLKLTNLDVKASATVKARSGIPVVHDQTPKIVKFSGPSRSQNEPFMTFATKCRAIQFRNPTFDSTSDGSADTALDSRSRIYKVESAIVNDDVNDNTTPFNYEFKLLDEVASEDQSYLNQLNATVDSVDVLLLGEDDVFGFQYQGRFFVKIEKRASFHNDIIAPSFKSDGNTYIKYGMPKIAVDTIRTAVSPNPDAVNVDVNIPSFIETLPETPTAFNEHVGIRSAGGSHPRTGSFSSVTIPILEERTVAQMGFDITTHSFTSSSITGSSSFTVIYGPTNADIDKVSEVFDQLVAGQKIRFRGNNSSNNNTVSDAYTIQSIGGSDPVSATLGGNPYESKTITLDRNYDNEIAQANIDGIQILGEVFEEPLVEKPAIFEIKTVKNIDLDIYYEASSAFDISELSDKKRLNYYNCIAFGNGVESTRIADDFNTPEIGKGVRVSSILTKPFKEQTKGSDLIFSGIINSRSDINESNQFLIAENITKSINPIHGTIQKLHARDTDLITLCEDKCFRILAQKDALFNADGNANLTASSNVLGQIIPYIGEYGISKNPESFASYGFRAYFTDKARRAVIRLSRDGITVISDQGMSDFIQDSMNATTNPLNGSYDESVGTYNLRIDSEQISYDEKARGWATRLTYQPEFALSLNNEYYSFKIGQIYKHNNTIRALFYSGITGQQDTTVTVIFNDSPSLIKNFKTISYEGDEGWTVSLETDKQTGVTRGTINPNLESRNALQFFNKEGKYYNFIGGPLLSWDNSAEHDGTAQTGNLDFAEFSTQGIDNIISYTDGATATMDFASNTTLPNSLQIGDTIFYIDDNDSDNVYKFGEVASITDTDSSTSITVTKMSGADAPGGSSGDIGIPEAGDFVFFVKDPRANTSGVIGYFNKATFTNTSSNKNELFAVGTEAFISS